MPSFLDPFPGVVPDKKLTNNELVRAIRLDMAAELEASHLYESHADATSNQEVKGLLIDISDEEKVHAGELLQLLEILDNDGAKFIDKGMKEAAKKLHKNSSPGIKKA